MHDLEDDNAIVKKEVRQSIVELLKKEGALFTSEIANKLKKSSSTTSKYLGVLEAKGIVERDMSKKPYVYWKVK
jgi:Mn-dependent DtxR family transcriptional regulator